MNLSEGTRYRLGVAARTVAAVAGGYAMTSAAMAALALWLPMAKVDATITASMLSIVLFACVVIWVFATRTALRAWIGVILATVLFLALFWLLRGTQ